MAGLGDKTTATLVFANILVSMGMSTLGILYAANPNIASWGVSALPGIILAGAGYGLILLREGFKNSKNPAINALGDKLDTEFAQVDPNLVATAFANLVKAEIAAKAPASSPQP